MKLGRSGVRVVDIGMRSNRHQHVLSVRGKDDVPGPVTTAAGQFGQGLSRAAGLHVPNLVRKTNHGCGVAHVHPLRIGATGIEVDPERALLVGGEGLHLAGLAVGVMPRMTMIFPGELSARKMSPLGAIRIRRGFSKPVANCSTLKPGRVWGHTPSGRGAIAAALLADSRGIRLGQVGHRDLAANAGMFLGVVGKGVLAGQSLLRDSRERTEGAKRDGEGCKQVLQVHGVDPPGHASSFSLVRICLLRSRRIRPANLENSLHANQGDRYHRPRAG